MKTSEILTEEDNARDTLKAALLKVCEAFYKKLGAKFGAEQTMKDFKIDGKKGFAGRPVKFTPETKFITKEVTITGGGGMGGRDVQASLWVIPLKKDGQQGQPLRLTYVDIPKY